MTRRLAETVGNYMLEKSLGQGTFGKVKLGKHLPTGERVAIKILQKDKIKDKSDVERITREIQILKRVKHPNI
jgi:5'-AMP-activated protein kinase catalytic alpha subunit